MSEISQESVEKTMERVAVDWLTTIAVAAIAICLEQIIHEGTHALSCILVGGQLQEFSALHVACVTDNVWQSKVVSASAALINILIGFILLAILRRSSPRTTTVQYFLWLFMLMNWLVGAGYLMFSGIANVGDWANVISGWGPSWLWRLSMAMVGAGAYLFFVWFSLHEMGKIIGGDTLSEQISRATKLGVWSYIAVVLVILKAGLFNPYGITGLPAVAAMMLALGGMSPLLWMMQWFRAKSFIKLPKEPLAVPRQWGWIISAAVIIFVYAFILGRGFYF